MTALGVQDAPGASLAAVTGQWQPSQPHAPRTPKQRKRELRKDRHRRRRIAERAEHDPTLTDFEVRVLKGYLCHSDDTGARVWPTVATVATKVHGTVRSVRRCVAQLEVAGYMKRFMRPLPGQRNQSNMYYFCEPTGPIADHRSNQRRRPRKRCSHRGTPETAGTPYGVGEPSRAGATKPTPPPRKPGYRRDLSPNSAPQRLTPILPIESPPPTTHASSTAVTNAIAAARAILSATKTNYRRPSGPQRRSAFGGPGL